jgi:hypothetical protein
LSLGPDNLGISQKGLDLSSETPEEVMHGAAWWANSLRGQGGVSEQQIEAFKDSLVKDVEIRCIYHWYPGSPQKGSGYRSIVNGVKMDEALKRACESAKVSKDVVPKGRIMFINPGEVKVQHKGEGDDKVEVVFLKSRSGGGGSQAAKKAMEERRSQHPFAQMMAKQLAKR